MDEILLEIDLEGIIQNLREQVIEDFCILKCGGNREEGKE